MVIERMLRLWMALRLHDWQEVGQGAGQGYLLRYSKESVAFHAQSQLKCVKCNEPTPTKG